MLQLQAPLRYMLEIHIRQTEVRNTLSKLDANKGCGPDGVPVIVLRIRVGASILTDLITYRHATLGFH